MATDENTAITNYFYKGKCQNINLDILYGFMSKLFKDLWLAGYVSILNEQKYVTGFI